MATFTVKLLDRQHVAEGTMAFRLERPAGFGYKPGQAVDVTLVEPPVTDATGQHRIFSLVSAPYENDLVVATRMRDSTFKNRLKAMAIGSNVQVEGPFGSLTLHHNRARPALFIAGGIGVTPFMSILRQAAQDRLDQHLLLVYANRRPEDAAFLSELMDLARRNKHFHLVATMTAMHKSASPWDGERGRVDESLLRRVAGELSAPIYYVAGPPAMVEAIRQTVHGIGVSDDDIRSEDFFGY
ncbi:MAG: ferredoxin--NADP reductase [Acidiferrobacteraceae bacterium]